MRGGRQHTHQEMKRARLRDTGTAVFRQTQILKDLTWKPTLSSRSVMSDVHNPGKGRDAGAHRSLPAQAAGDLSASLQSWPLRAHVARAKEEGWLPFICHPNNQERKAGN